MRKFIISDLHGNGNMYDNIMNYLENINKEEDVTLYINGDLIDRGPDSARMLIDVKNRITNNIGFKIEYLAGNHELMMYQASLGRKNGKWPSFCDWFLGNGGQMTAEGLRNSLTIEEENEIIDFVSNLKIYHKFNEKIAGKKIVLVHAKCPKIVNDVCDLKIKNNNYKVEQLLWTRQSESYVARILNIKNEIGNSDYFTIIGHTPLTTKYGYEYYKEENCLNIDGGSAGYVNGYEGYDHQPLVEIIDNRLNILTFNNNNEIIYGNCFKNGTSTKMKGELLENYRYYIKKSNKVKKLKNKM